MKQYLLGLIIVITIIVFCLSYSQITETIESSSSTLPDNNQIVINNSESLRDFLGKMRYICNLDENTIYDSVKPTVCYKINKLYTYFNSVKEFLDNKTEEEIMDTYGPQEEQVIAGQKVGPKPADPIIGSQYDYYMLILLSTYMKILKPYNDLKIWSQNNNESPPTITSHCSYSDNDAIQFVSCAKNILSDITKILNYFQYQPDKSNQKLYGDTAETGTGDVPKT